MGCLHRGFSAVFQCRRGSGAGGVLVGRIHVFEVCQNRCGYTTLYSAEYAVQRILGLHTTIRELAATQDAVKLIRLPQLCAIRFIGPDAGVFLQGQLSHDTRLLEQGRTLLASCNTPQGRVIALLRLRKSGDVIHAWLPADLGDSVLTHLRKYVLRAKVSIERADELSLYGMTMAAGDEWDMIERDLAAAGAITFHHAAARYVVAMPEPSPGTSLAERPAIVADEASVQLWRAEDIRAGLPQIEAATSGEFVAQMLNLDLLDGISFNKGCYTGQEIIVRTQHLGRIKRRTLRYRLTGDTLPKPLEPMLREGVKVADVLTAARVSDGVELLAVANLESRDLPLRMQDGRTAQPAALPYSIVPTTTGE